MKKDQFNQIIKATENLAKELSDAVTNYSTDKILNFSAVDFNNYYQKLESLQSKLDKLNCDLYHIIGMGNLSSGQMLQFIAKVKLCLLHRNSIKQIVNTKSSYQNLRKVASETTHEYTLSLTSLKLKAAACSK